MCEEQEPDIRGQARKVYMFRLRRAPKPLPVEAGATLSAVNGLLKETPPRPDRVVLGRELYDRPHASCRVNAVRR